MDQFSSSIFLKNSETYRKVALQVNQFTLNLEF